ncbi:MAG: GAF domain-containing protein [Candidatus Lokiarchaeota archaeon]|nr:GAF domain-containing protein [Candidatus Lokiarchaeota archaeon]
MKNEAKNLDSKEIKSPYKEIFDKMNNGVAIYKAIENGEDFRFVNINQAAEEIDKIKKEQVIGQKLTDIFPGVNDFGLLDVLRKVWKSGEPKRHPISKYKDNRIEGWRDNYVYKLSSGEIVTIYDDVSVLKLKEKQLRKTLEESEKRRNQITALLKATKAVLEYKHFKDAAKAIFEVCKDITGAQSGYIALLSDDGSENEVLFLDSGGLPCKVNPDLPMPIRGLRAEAYEKGKPIYDNNFMKSDWIKYLPYGHVELKNVLFAPLNLENKTIGLIGLANKKNGFNENDKNLSAGLSELVAIALKNSQMLESLENSRQECLYAYNQANLYKDLFTHDINNILHNIKTASDLLSNIMEQKLEFKKVQELIGMINDQIIRGSNLISNIRKLSELDMLSGNLHTISLNKELTKAISFVKESYPNKNIMIDYESPSENYHIKGNEFLVEVFENILINAVKYTGNNPKIQIRVSVMEENINKFAKIEFIDNGIGIPNEMKESLFKSRIKKDKESSGMGLGLILTKKILEVHNGKIWVQNRIKGDYKKGSNFVVLLPLLE